jgi:hypothetical protein
MSVTRPTLRFLPGAELEELVVPPPPLALAVPVVPVVPVLLLELLPHAARARTTIRLSTASPNNLIRTFTRLPFGRWKDAKITFGQDRAH